MADSQSNDNSTCVVCFKTVQYFSIGECDHPVCFECSTRMRVLCLQNECPICRQVLARVVFTDTVKPYKELRAQVFSEKLFERQFKIGFCSEEIKQAYGALLLNCCKLCPKLPPFHTFSALSDHMRKVHERFYCDLCVKHLKIFTSERKFYTRQELGHHRRKGDLDDTSHRGHPLCEFCEERFMDADELYRHLRKEHLYCHLCDADGRNHYYATHDALAHHFRTDHYLCEEGECDGQHLTAVFRSEIDLKAHKASVHGKGLARAAARQARTLELQFNITPHPVAQRNPRPPAEPPAPLPPQAPTPRLDPRSDEDFPRLSNAPAPVMIAAPTSRQYKGPGGLARTDKNFPALDGATARPSSANTPQNSMPVAATIVRNSKPSVSIHLHSQPASASNFRLTQPTGNRISIPAQQKRSPLCDDDFPTLGVGMSKDDHPSLGAGTVQPSKVTLINSQDMKALKSNHTSQQHKKPQLSSEAFPALSSSSAPTAPPQWIKISKSKEKVKQVKPDPPPPREANFNAVADFPTLPANTKSKSKKPAPAPHITSSQPNNTVKTKKDKKKGSNPKKENFSECDDWIHTNEKKNIRNSEILASVNANNSLNNNEEKKIKTIDANGSVNGEKNSKGNGDFSLKVKEYPPLSGKSAEASSVERVTNGYGAPPPGFSKRPTCQVMTFTNSSGQTFPAPPHSYLPPPNFENRNRALVNKFTSALGSATAVENFKVASRAFRDSIINAEEFYQHCKKAVGSELDSVFPELIALLPDIGKQQELARGRGMDEKLCCCATCGQLLSPSDETVHHTAHWPPLASR